MTAMITHQTTVATQNSNLIFWEDDLSIDDIDLISDRVSRAQSLIRMIRLSFSGPQGGSFSDDRMVLMLAVEEHLKTASSTSVSNTTVHYYLAKACCIADELSKGMGLLGQRFFEDEVVLDEMKVLDDCLVSVLERLP